MSVTFSKYYFKLESDTKERYDENLRRFKASEDPYCLSIEVGYQKEYGVSCAY